MADENEVAILAAQAAVIDAELLPQQPEAEGKAEGGAAGGALDTVTEASDLIKFAVSLFTPLYPSIVGVYTPENQDRLAAVSAPLMEKYGITMGGIFEKWGPEINFLIVAGPVAMETVKAIRHDNAERRKEAEKAKAKDAANEQPGE